jgi:hypothetical protein
VNFGFGLLQAFEKRKNGNHIFPNPIFSMGFARKIKKIAKP